MNRSDKVKVAWAVALATGAGFVVTNAILKPPAAATATAASARDAQPQPTSASANADADLVHVWWQISWPYTEPKPHCIVEQRSPLNSLKAHRSSIGAEVFLQDKGYEVDIVTEPGSAADAELQRYYPVEDHLIESFFRSEAACQAGFPAEEAKVARLKTEADAAAAANRKLDKYR